MMDAPRGTLRIKSRRVINKAGNEVIYTYLTPKIKPKVKCYCSFCTKEFIGFEGKKYCSPACASYICMYTNAAGPQIRTCKGCSKTFITTSQTGKELHCSTECYTQTEASRVIIKNRAWRQKEREHVNKLIVFERDGWQCKMCQTPTPKELMGSYLPNEPTLDHIIPLSKGGTHTYKNTQLLCRKCNCHIKNDRIL